MMYLIRALMGGIVGSMLGAAVWAILGQFTNVDLGVLAILIGLLSGLGVQRACALDHVNYVQGAIAAACTVMAIFGAKYSVVQHHVETAKTEIEQFQPPRDDLVAIVAGELVKQIDASCGSQITATTTPVPGNSPAGSDAAADDDLAAEAVPPSRESLPPAVWKVAEEVWETFGEQDRAKYVEEVKQAMADRQGFGPDLRGKPADELASAAFRESFCRFDFLWTGIGLVAAFVLGKTERFADDEEEAYEAVDDDDDDEEDEEDEDELS